MDQRQASSPTHPVDDGATQATSNSHINRHSYITMAGPLIPPSNSLVRQYIMGASTAISNNQNANNSGRPIQSNLTALLQRHEEEKNQREPQYCDPASMSRTVVVPSNEADSASGPSFTHHSAPIDASPVPRNTSQPPVAIPPLRHPTNAAAFLAVSTDSPRQPQHQQADTPDSQPRRCISSKELRTLAPPSGSPYAYMLYKKEMLEAIMRQRLQERRESVPRSQSSSPPLTTANAQQYTSAPIPSDLDSSSDSRCSTPAVAALTVSGMANERRNRRRAEHNQAVISDLCEIVADLFIAEAKLLNPSSYGVVAEDEKSMTHHHQSSTDNQLLSQQRRRRILQAVQVFVSSLPTRYALGVETPSEVLVHMRLMSAVRADDTKAVVHIVNLDEPEKHHHHHYTLTSAGSTRTNSSTMLTTLSNPELIPVIPSTPPHRKQQNQRQTNRRSIRLVTIACGDADGLLEYITKLLGTGGSRVVDADVMLSRDNIVLDRFVVEMNGRLRLDKLANYIESFLKECRESEKRRMQPQSQQSTIDVSAYSPQPYDLFYSPSGRSQREYSPDNKSSSSGSEPSGPLYVPSSLQSETLTPREKIQEEMETAVPLTTVLASGDPMSIPVRGSSSNHPLLRRQKSMPTYPVAGTSRSLQRLDTSHSAQQSGSVIGNHQETQSEQQQDQATNQSMRQRRPLVNRQGKSDLDRIGDSDDDPSLDFVTVPSWDHTHSEGRLIPLIPFEDLMLIETLGTGRVSTIYRAAWKKKVPLNTSGNNDRIMWGQTSTVNPEYVEMVALKVAMVNSETRDTSNVDELRREGDIAARLQHPNICDLVGVAADSECFCLAFDFCEGGSLLTLLSDTSRYYEYLPIALDVANGMAYLHSRNVIHRDLKPSNVLLTKDHRAKIADFGMSVSFSGQELTAETGTYRYMAPEVIRHESYSSNADVYSFGICLWQLITREVPFATMTPIQAAYAVAEGRRPEIPESTPRRLQEIITACWEQDSHKRPSFTYIALALADYAKMAFSPANVGAQTLHIANEMLANVEGNSTVNVDFSTLVSASTEPPVLGGWLFNYSMRPSSSWQHADSASSDGANVGLEI